MRTGVSGVVLVSYYGQPILLHDTKEHDIDLGNVLLTDVGEQLARIAGGEPHVAYQESVVDLWTKRGLRPASPVDWEARSSAPPTPPA
jgi:hypothetical protein